MPDTTMTTYADAALLGALAGGRSMAAPALLAEYLRRQGPAASLRRPFNLLANPRAALLFKVAALGEVIADKLPTTPNRIESGPLAGRMAAGALAGISLAMRADASPLAGAVVGGAAAAAGSYAGYALRRWLGQRLPIPDPFLGLAEDILVYGAGLRWLRGKA